MSDKRKRSLYQKARKSITRQSILKLNEKFNKNKELVNESTRIMYENLHKTMRRGYDLDLLVSNADRLNKISQEFNQNAITVKKKNKYKYLKWTILLIIALLVLVGLVLSGISIGLYFKYKKAS
jgi:hypothetical protein